MSRYYFTSIALLIMFVAHANQAVCKESNNYKYEKEYAIHEGEESVVRISQSLTGNIISASIS